MVQRCWVNFKCRGVLLIWIIVGQGPIALAVGAGGGCLDIFSLIYHFSFLSPSLWETARYRLKYCLKGPLSPKQPTNQPTVSWTQLMSGGAHPSPFAALSFTNSKKVPIYCWVDREFSSRRMAKPSLELTRYGDFLRYSRAALTTRPRRLSLRYRYIMSQIRKHCIVSFQRYKQ